MSLVAHIPSVIRLGEGSVLKNRLKEIRKSRGLTLEKLSEMSGVSLSQISRIEKGERGWSVDSLPKLAEALNVTVAELIDTSQVWLDAPVIGSFGQHVWARLKFNGANNFPTIRVPAAYGNVFALTINGSAYYPRYMEGQIVAVASLSLPPEDCLGKECLTGVDTGYYALKFVFEGSQPDHFVLTSHNEPAIPNRKLLSCRPVVYSGPAGA